MCGRDTHFIDPQLGRWFIRVDIDHCAYKSNYDFIIERNDKSVPQVIEEFLCRRLDNRVIEDTLRDIQEDVEFV